MKILHTADWHIGKKLHKHDLSADHKAFITWFEQLVIQKNIDVVLISGDIFDLASPSSESRALYYDALVRLIKHNCTVIITGGNHDSPSVLNAPKHVLKALNIHVIGNFPENPEDVLIPLPNADAPELVVAAIPFLRESDLRQMMDGETYEDRMEAVRKGISSHFTGVSKASHSRFPNIPIMAMGHLFAAGVTSSESERDIQIGNQALVDANAFGNEYCYVALGHIHKPQKVSGNIPIYYSGSPIALSFSERKDLKRVLLIDTTQGFEPESIPVPCFRELKRISGTFTEVKKALSAFIPQGDLTDLIELDVTELEYNPELAYLLDQLVLDYKIPGAEIIKCRLNFKNQLRGTASLFSINEQLQDLKPMEVFAKKLTSNALGEELRTEIMDAFRIILDEALNQESNENQ